MGGNNFPADVDLDVFINDGQELENAIQQGEQEDGQIPAPAAAVQLVYECCDRIRLQGLHPHPDIRRISGDLLRLKDTNNDFETYMSRIDKRALDLFERFNDVFQEPANINLTPFEPTLRAQLVEEAWDVVIEFHTKLSPRHQRIKYMYKYHIRSIKELQLRKANGEIGNDVISQTKFNYLSQQLLILQLTPLLNNMGMLILAILIQFIACYLRHYHSKRRKTPTRNFPRRTCYKKVPLLGLLYFICCTVIMMTITIGRNSELFDNE